MKKRKFCTHCGKELSEVTTGIYEDIPASYDCDTGEIIKRLQCLNKSCIEGCGYYGHKLSFFSRSCKRCGYVERYF